jgi:hypothetical protein
MNLENVSFHLGEAREALDKILESIQKDKEYSDAEFSVEMAHAYYHINTAWNSRNASQKDVIECSEENFNKWKKFPLDPELEFEA